MAQFISEGGLHRQFEADKLMGMKRDYEVARNPANKMWYVIGYCGVARDGREQWVAVSAGYKAKAGAEARIGPLRQADASARRELVV